MTLPQIELLLERLGAIAGITTLAIALVAVFLSLRRAPAREEPGARIFLRGPALILLSSLFIALAAILWNPIPLRLALAPRASAVLLGAVFLFAGLGLYLWGLFTLRGMFAPSSGFGVRIQAAHTLVTSGPYRYIRHPMYLAVIVATFGAFLVYRTWAALFFAVAMFGLVVRARREERILAAEFGTDWQGYASRVPMWFPRTRPGHRGGA
jgi:protein-S-isoprenylcysteine O-methyltransferase Ste14